MGFLKVEVATRDSGRSRRWGVKAPTCQDHQGLLLELGSALLHPPVLRQLVHLASQPACQTTAANCWSASSLYYLCVPFQPANEVFRARHPRRPAALCFVETVDLFHPLPVYRWQFLRQCSLIRRTLRCNSRAFSSRGVCASRLFASVVKSCRPSPVVPRFQLSCPAKPGATCSRGSSTWFRSTSKARWTWGGQPVPVAQLWPSSVLSNSVHQSPSIDATHFDSHDPSTDFDCTSRYYVIDTAETTSEIATTITTTFRAVADWQQQKSNYLKASSFGGGTLLKWS